MEADGRRLGKVPSRRYCNDSNMPLTYSDGVV